jgi:hypothetical protein
MPLDLEAVKEKIQTVLQGANSVGAAYDLSQGMDPRVAHVLKVNPYLIPVQADWHPYVTCFVDSKELKPEDFAGTQSFAKRSAKVNVKVVGCVWNTLTDDPETDNADDECNQLMENIEEVLRRNPTLDGIATWHFPERVQYYNASLDEDTMLRAGILDLAVTVFY